MVEFKCTRALLAVVEAFREAFSQRSWPYFLSVVLPWLLHQGQRTVRRLLVGAGFKRHETGFYRFFSQFRFRRHVFFRLLFEQVVKVFKLPKIVIAVDDTLCRKWGKKIFGTASFFDHTSRPRPGYIWGHNWVVLAIVVKLFGVYVSLPFWVSLYRPRKICGKGEFRTRLEIVAEALSCARSWTSLPIQVLADGAYNNRSLLVPLARLGLPLVSRLRSDAVLRADPPPRRRGTRGRPPRFGPPLPKLSALARSRKGWKTVQVEIYRKAVRLQVKSFDAWWPKSGQRIRVVITKDPRVPRRISYLSSTDLAMTPMEIIESFSQRWSIEQMFADAKLELGLDTAEVRTPKSVLRHAALAFGFITIVRLWSLRRFARRKEMPKSFKSQLGVLREDTIIKTIFSSIPRSTRSGRKAQGLAKVLQ